MVKKNCNLEDLFFEIELRPVYWETNGNVSFIKENLWYSQSHPQLAEEYMALVDPERKHLFSIFKRSYNPITYKEAYKVGMTIARSIFMRNEKDSYFQIKPFRVRMSKDRAVASVYMERDVDEKQPLLNYGWKAFLRIVNSYNGTKALNYTFGFKYMDNSFCLVFPELAVNLTIDKHKGNIYNQIREQLGKNNNINTIQSIEDAFIRKLEQLKKAEIVDTMFVPLFCKFENITTKKLSAKEAYYKNLIKEMLVLKRKYQREGQHLSAYDFLLIILDYMSNRKQDQMANSLKEDSPMRAGIWADSYLEMLAKKESPYKYIGQEFFDVAVMLEKLE